LYAAGIGAPICKYSNDGTGWVWTETYLGGSSNGMLATFGDYLYRGVCTELHRYDGAAFEHVWTEPDRYFLRSMVETDTALIFGVHNCSPFTARVYAYDGTGEPQKIGADIIGFGTWGTNSSSAVDVLYFTTQDY
jgi:hypothetical protein